jgi:hypothetical protein
VIIYQPGGSNRIVKSTITICFPGKLNRGLSVISAYEFFYCGSPWPSPPPKWQANLYRSIHIFHIGDVSIRFIIWRSTIEFTQVACALLMAGENLDNHVDVKNILVEMGTYFQVQVNSVLSFFLLILAATYLSFLR